MWLPNICHVYLHSQRRLLIVNFDYDYDFSTYLVNSVPDLAGCCKDTKEFILQSSIVVVFGGLWGLLVLLNLLVHYFFGKMYQIVNIP